ncbi:hypothetical protein [Noviherbaspirillum galbum]|uniref:Uncharacterized protein n=1 Tax=Noviherbaspirillum galbum TaxID=2709383 RepID=A0A6B3SSE3_9BURK|nr:hypothetical protein [Noviherbaspirillum galbum]NEX60519.1 hypothetical protein [Noviherbaspirillum galbum]
MPALDGAWRAVRQRLSRSHVHDGASCQRAGTFRISRLVGWLRDQVLAARRHNEQMLIEEARRARCAKRRALGLLTGLLDTEQRQEFRTLRYFHVIGGSTGTRYRIRVASFANIDVLGATGRPMYRLCAHPAGDIPIYDIMAGQLLHLQDPTTEERFLRMANVHTALSELRPSSGPNWVP